MTLGDLRAQLAATHIGEDSVLKIIRRYDLATFQGCCRDLLAYTERLVRSEIASWPDGSSGFTDYMDSDGVGGPPVRLQVTLTIRGDTLTADFTGTDPQVPGGINCTLSFTTSVVAVCLRAVVQADIPNTAGMFKPLNVHCPGRHRGQRRHAGRIVHARDYGIPPFGHCSGRPGRVAARPSVRSRRRG